MIEIDDLVIYRDAVWRVEYIDVGWDNGTPIHEFFDIKWIAGPHIDRVTVVIGVMASEIRLVTDMEVLALAAQEDL